MLPAAPQAVLPPRWTWFYAIGWFALVCERSTVAWLPEMVEWVFLASLPIGIYVLRHAVVRERRNWLVIAIAASIVYVYWWHLAVVVTDLLAWDATRATIARVGLGALFFLGLAWVIWVVDTISSLVRLPRRNPTVRVRLLGTGPVPQLGPQVAAPDIVPSPVDDAGARQPRPAEIWNPLDVDAWFYGLRPRSSNPFRVGAWRHDPRTRKLDQSVFTLGAYTTSFASLCLVAASLGGCREIYEMPAGGGEQATRVQVVKVQRIIRKKFVVNPFSAILFEVPPIDEVKLQLQEVTKHAYKVGYGEGKGAGFAGGTRRGKVRFIRLEYPGGDWDQDFGIGGDLNMLLEYGIRTQHKVAEKTESRRIDQLKNFPVGKSPPVVYLTGQRNISISNAQVKILREYLDEKHGMLFCDNGGSRHFHNQFVALMNRVMPDVRPVQIPLDDVIHRIPYQIPFLPYVAPHGGKDALGWYKNGRWVAYYHPGDIGDAWSDGHAGVDPEIYEACYQLGTNVFFYAHTEYAKWLEARQQKQP